MRFRVRLEIEDVQKRVDASHGTNGKWILNWCTLSMFALYRFECALDLGSFLHSNAENHLAQHRK